MLQDAFSVPPIDRLAAPRRRQLRHLRHEGAQAVVFEQSGRTREVETPEQSGELISNQSVGAFVDSAEEGADERKQHVPSWWRSRYEKHDLELHGISLSLSLS